MSLRDQVEYSQISHHIGTLLFVPLDQIIVLSPLQKLRRNNQNAKAKMPVFHERLTICSSGIVTRAQAMKFAIGTSGYVGSIIPNKG